MSQRSTCLPTPFIIAGLKHIELDIHFVREKVALGQFRVVHVPTNDQLTDIMKKGLPTSSLEKFRSSLGIISDDASTAGGVREDHVSSFVLV
jgi:hypothetical protein